MNKAKGQALHHTSTTEPAPTRVPRHGGAYAIVGIPLYRADRHPRTGDEADTDVRATGATQLRVGLDRVVEGRVTLWAGANPNDGFGYEFDFLPEHAGTLAIDLLEAAARAGHDAWGRVLTAASSARGEA